MSCLKDEPRLSAWMDGELSETEAKLAAEHVNACAVCRAQVTALRAVRFPTAEPDPNFIVRFREAKARQPWSPFDLASQWRKLAFGLVPLAAAILVAALLVALGNDRDPLELVELEALGDPGALEVDSEMVTSIAFEPFPEDLP